MIRVEEALKRGLYFQSKVIKMCLNRTEGRSYNFRKGGGLPPKTAKEGGVHPMLVGGQRYEEAKFLCNFVSKFDQKKWGGGVPPGTTPPPPYPGLELN